MKRRTTIGLVIGAVFTLVLGLAAWGSVTQRDSTGNYAVGVNDTDKFNMTTQYRERAAGGVVFEELDLFPSDCSQYETNVANVERVTIRNQYGDKKWQRTDINQGCRLHFYGMNLAVGSANCADVYALVHPHVDNFPDPQEQTLHIEVCVN